MMMVPNIRTHIRTQKNHVQSPNQNQRQKELICCFVYKNTCSRFAARIYNINTPVCRAYVFSDSLFPRKKKKIETYPEIYTTYNSNPHRATKCYTIIQNTLNSRIFLTTKFLLLQEISYTYTHGLSIYININMYE